MLVMEIELTPEQSDFVRHAVETGRIREPAQAAQQAMALWVERERRRVELWASLGAAEASLARGEGIAISADSMTSLARGVMDRCRARIETDRAETG
jgi:Arc/MetJ-type ribon-helix-helix transcriptional regulator